MNEQGAPPFAKAKKQRSSLRNTKQARRAHALPASIAYPTPRGMIVRCKQVSRLGFILLARLPTPARGAVAFVRVRPLHGYWDSPEFSSVFP